MDVASLRPSPSNVCGVRAQCSQGLKPWKMDHDVLMFKVLVALSLFFCKHKIVDTEKKHQNSFCTVPLLLMMLRISPRKCFPGQGTTWMHVVLVQIKNIACQKLAKSCQNQNPSPFSSSKTLHMWDSYTCDFSYTKMNFPDSSLWKNALGILSKKTFASLITTVQKSCKTNHSRSCGVNNDHFKSFLTLMRMCKFMLQEL